MRLLSSLAGFIAGAIAVYVVAMGLAVFGWSTLAGLPYEQLLGWMAVGGILAAAVPLMFARRAAAGPARSERD